VVLNYKKYSSEKYIRAMVDDYLLQKEGYIYKMKCEKIYILQKVFQAVQIHILLLIIHLSLVLNLQLEEDRYLFQ
jgi:hypothetical protein